jgi:hypothetical protein
MKIQTLAKETATDRLASGLYSLFIPMEWNYEGFIDSYGHPVFDTPDEEVQLKAHMRAYRLEL